jgi:hypothetical protein
MSVWKTILAPKRFLVIVCVFAFCLRLSVMFAAGTYHVVEDDTNHFGFGWEMGRVAASIAEGKGFASPLPSPTGPTAIVGPIYPLLLSAIFKVFGTYSVGSAIAVRILQSILSSLTCVFLYLCGRDTMGERVGRLAAIVWSVFPLNIFFTVTKVWETSLTAILAAALFWYMVETGNSLSSKRWSKTGALLGIAALVNTSLVVLIVPIGLFALWRNRIRALLPTFVGALTCLALVSPWLVRNYIVFGKGMLRSNFPLEFRIGNNELSYGQKMESLHPSNTPALNQHWSQVGEQRFMEEDRELNARYVNSHPGRFAFSIMNRIVNYWTGAWVRSVSGFPNVLSVICATSLLSLLGFLGLWRLYSSDNPTARNYAGCLAVYPIVYYITTSQPRFYHAITPLLILLGAYFVIDCFDRVAEREAQPDRSMISL